MKSFPFFTPSICAQGWRQTLQNCLIDHAACSADHNFIDCQKSRRIYGALVWLNMKQQPENLVKKHVFFSFHRFNPQARKNLKKMAWKLNFSSATKRKDNLKRRHVRDSLPWRYIKVALMKLCFLDHFVVSRTLLRMCYMQVLSKQRPSWQRPQFAVPATKCAKREKNSRSTCVLSPWEVGIWSIDVSNLQFFTRALSGGQTFQLDCAFKSLRHLSHFVVDHTPPL